MNRQPALYPHDTRVGYMFINLTRMKLRLPYFLHPAMVLPEPRVVGGGLCLAGSVTICLDPGFLLTAAAANGRLSVTIATEMSNRPLNNGRICWVDTTIPTKSASMFSR
jgi:hypothetical protein